MAKARKFNAKKTTYKGINFDSKLEAEYYKYLLTDENIALIDLQPEFQIIQKHEVVCKRCKGSGRLLSDKTGNLVQCSLCKGEGDRNRQGAIYTADFRVTYSDGYIEVIDVKGYKGTAEFRLRKKLFEVKTGIELIVTEKIRGVWIRK